MVMVWQLKFIQMHLTEMPNFLNFTDQCKLMKKHSLIMKLR